LNNEIPEESLGLPILRPVFDERLLSGVAPQVLRGVFMGMPLNGGTVKFPTMRHTLSDGGAY
jgi:hypothetical protein